MGALRIFLAILLCGLCIAGAVWLGSYRQPRSQTTVTPAQTSVVPGRPAQCVQKITIPGVPGAPAFHNSAGSVPAVPATPAVTEEIPSPCYEPTAIVRVKATPALTLTSPAYSTTRRWKVRPSWLDPARILLGVLGLALGAAMLAVRRPMP